MFELFSKDGQALYIWKSIRDMEVGDVFKVDENFQEVISKENRGGSLILKTQSVVF